MKPFPFAVTPKTDDERFMLEALKEAWKAYQTKEVPVGAVLVKGGHVIARGYNQVEMLKDATAHAEMLCLTVGQAAEENWRLLETTLYCTIEPCSMCAGAILLTRVPRIVWGAPDIRHGAGGSWVNLFEKKHPTHSVEITQGVLEGLAAELLQDFFRKRRKDG
ncbi:MAG: tRNA adenosine(34) deaminase TadA [Waddliaceae bacterium]